WRSLCWSTSWEPRSSNAHPPSSRGSTDGTRRHAPPSARARRTEAGTVVDLVALALRLGHDQPRRPGDAPGDGPLVLGAADVAAARQPAGGVHGTVGARSPAVDVGSGLEPFPKVFPPVLGLSLAFH